MVQNSWRPRMVTMMRSLRSLVTLIELKYGILSAGQLKGYRENGGIRLKITFTIDAESVFKSLTSRDLKTPAEKTLMGHVVWLRELLKLGLIQKVQWCDTRDMSADGHTKGSIERQGLLDLMQGKHKFLHEVKEYIPHRRDGELPKNRQDGGTYHCAPLLCWMSRVGLYSR
jgi:hypothetical protein